MDIDLLSKMIKELVMDHDRVSLPGLGVFVAERQYLLLFRIKDIQ